MNIRKFLDDLFSGKKSGQIQDYTDTREKLEEIAEETVLPERPTLPESKSYERMEYTAPTDEEIRAEAEKSLAGYRQSGMRAIDDEYSALSEKYAADREAGKSAYERGLKELNSAYDAAVENASNDALKRGLARSSIAANVAAGLYGEKAEKQSAAASEFEKADGDLAEKIRGLEVKRQRAMDDFDITYASKLSEQISSLTDRREQLRREALKYNNSLTEKENDDALARQKAESDLYSEALSQEKARRDLIDNPTQAQQDDKDAQSYAVLREKLESMSSVDAYNEIRKNPIYRQYLSPHYFYLLYDEFGR